MRGMLAALLSQSPASKPASPPPRGSRVSWETETFGGISSLVPATSPVPSPAADEAVIAVRAIGLNYADVFCVLGLYEAANAVIAATGGAFCPGLEFAGEVLSVGSDVTQFKPGERVYGFCRFGAYRSVVAAREPLLRRIPDEWSYAEAAGLLVQGLTAWHGLVELGVARAGSRVLVHSAAGGVGCAALSICEALGCEAVGVVGGEHKRTFLTDRFSSPGGWRPALLVRRSEREYASQLDDLAGAARASDLPGSATNTAQFDVVLDSLGGRYFTAALDRLAPMGRLVHFGATYSYGGASDGLRKWLTLVPGWLGRPKVDPGELVGTNRAVMGFNLIWWTPPDALTPARRSRLSEPYRATDRCSGSPSARRCSRLSSTPCSHAAGSSAARPPSAVSSTSRSCLTRSSTCALARAWGKWW